jgi:ribonuclease P/MRP protein subunit RPP1
MKHSFFDLHLRVDIKDKATTNCILQKAATLGYTTISVPGNPQTSSEETEQLRNLCKKAGLNFASRIDLQPRNQNELLSQLRKFRRKFEVVCVLCENKEVARQAAKDRRVDLLNFTRIDYRNRFFDRSEAELASSGLAILEIDIKPLLVLVGPARVRFLSCLRREIQIAKDYHLPVVISSGISDPMLLRKPREMAALASMFGLEGVYGLEAVSNNPLTIVRRNREKLSCRFVAPGIRIIKEGKNIEES